MPYFRAAFGVLWSVFFLACSSEKDEAQSPEIIASWQSYKLTELEIDSILPPEYTSEDSAEFVNAYIDNWLKNKILVDNARKSIQAAGIQKIKKKVKEYENDLLINEYHLEIINKKVSDSVRDSEIENYYNKHSESFTLNKDVYQLKFIIVSPSKVEEVEPMFRSSSDVNKEKLEKFAEENNLPIYFSQDEWLSAAELLQKIPLQISQEELDQLWQTSYLKQESISETLLVKITNKTLKGTQAPLTYVKEDIKNLLINKRKITLLDSLENRLLTNEKENIFRK